MITLGQEQRLGRKSFFLLASKRTTFGLGVFVLALIIAILRPLILSGTASGLASAGGTFTRASVVTMSASVSYAIGALFVFSLIVIALGFLISWLEYRNYAFRFEEFDMIMRRGILRTEEVSIPYRQMQDINIQRSLAYRMMGLSRLIIDSAGHEEKDEHNETDVILEPLNKETAEEIRSFLERKIGVQIVVDQKVADAESGATPGAVAPTS